MSFLKYYNKIIEFRENHNSLLNTWANHLLVIFAFFIPVSMSGRQSTLFLIMLVFLLRGNYVDYLKEGIKDKLVQAFVIYFLIHVIWLLGTDNFEFAKKVVHEAKFLLYPLLFITLIDRKYIPRILGAFLLGMLVSELWSYGIYFQIFPPNIHDGGQGTPLSPSPVHHHSHYGFMLAITVALLLQRLFSVNDPVWLKVVISLFFITATMNIFINAGRTGYILFVVLIVVLFLIAMRKRLIVVVVSALALVTVSFLLAYNLSDTFNKRLNKTMASIESMYMHDNYYSSLGIRAAVLFGSKDRILDNWLLGVGTGDQLDEMRNSIKKNKPAHLGMANSVQHLHNEYFSAVLQFGIIGLLSFMYIMYCLIVYAQSDRSLKTMQIVLAVAVFMFSFVDIIVHGLGVLLTLVILVSLSFNSYSVSNAIYNPMSKQQLLLYAMLVLIIEPISWVS